MPFVPMNPCNHCEMGTVVSPWTKTQGSSSDVFRVIQLAASGAAWDSSSLPNAFSELTKEGMFQEGFRKG